MSTITLKIFSVVTQICGETLDSSLKLALFPVLLKHIGISEVDHDVVAKISLPDLSPQLWSRTYYKYTEVVITPGLWVQLHKSDSGTFINLLNTTRL